MAIQINISMPKSCSDCPIKAIEEDIYGDVFYYCPLIRTAIRGEKYLNLNKQRFRKCPLVEVKEEKNDGNN